MKASRECSEFIASETLTELGSSFSLCKRLDKRSWTMLASITLALSSEDGGKSGLRQKHYKYETTNKGSLPIDDKAH